MATKPVTSIPSRNIDSEVQRAIKQLFDAGNRHDVEALVRCYAPDAVLLPPNYPRCEGHEGIRQFFKASFEAGFDRVEGGADRIEYEGDLITIVGHNITQLRQPDGTTKIQKGKCLEVRRRQQNGELRLIFHCFNTDEPV